MKTKRGFIDVIAISLLTAGLSCAYTVHLDKPMIGYESENYKLDWIHIDKNEYTYCFNKIEK